MDTTTLSSTFLLTLLLMVGLFFFIRASVKDRTQQIQLTVEESAATLRHKLQNYFDQRAYQRVNEDSEPDQVTFRGFVQPSRFMAVFLTLLAGCGWLCLALVFSILYPGGSFVFLGLTLVFSPLAGIFYWRAAGRWEQVTLKVESLSEEQNQEQSQITIQAHRDEIIALRRGVSLKFVQSS